MNSLRNNENKNTLIISKIILYLFLCIFGFLL